MNSSAPWWAALLSTLASALCAFAVALLSKRSSTFLQRQKSELDASLQRQKSELDAGLAHVNSLLAGDLALKQARIDYVYDARKRLYVECEPVLFLLNEYGDFASRRIRAMARLVRKGQGKDNFNTDDYYLLSSIYYIFRPLVSYGLLRSRLGAVDLALDDYISVQFQLCKLLYRTFTHGGSIARRKPKLKAQMRKRATPERQDLSLGQLDIAVQAMVRASGSPENPRERCVTFGEFEAEVTRKGTDLRSAFSEVVPLFLRFDPTTHPILWRILIAQTMIYELISQETRQRPTRGNGERPSIAPAKFSAGRVAGYRWSSAASDEHATPLLESFTAAHNYVRDRAAKNATLAQFIDEAEWKAGALPPLERLQKRLRSAAEEPEAELDGD